MDKNMSQLDIAYSIIKDSGKVQEFSSLWEEVAKIKEFTPEEKEAKVSRFYTNLIIDPRFVSLGDNTWDLRENQTFDKVKLDMNSVYSELEQEAKESYDEEDQELSIEEDSEEDSEEENSQLEENDENI